MTYLEQIQTLLIAIGSIAAVLMILVCVVKILTTDEGETRVYIKRIKNVIIAYVCLLMICTVKDVITSSYVQEEVAGIGTLDTAYTGQDETSVKDDASVLSVDKQGRTVIKASYGRVDYVLVLTDTESTSNKFKSETGYDTVYIWRLYGDCQGVLSGAGQTIYFFSFTTNFSSNKNDSDELYHLYSFYDADDMTHDDEDGNECDCISSCIASGGKDNVRTFKSALTAFAKEHEGSVGSTLTKAFRYAYKITNYETSGSTLKESTTVTHGGGYGDSD